MREKIERILTHWAFRQACDQILHMLWAFYVVLPVILWPGPIGGALSALALSLPREFVDQWPINRIGDTIADIGSFVIGGVIAGWLL